MSIPAKVYKGVLFNRIRKLIDAMLRKNQAGFRMGRSWIQQIHILRHIWDGAAKARQISKIIPRRQLQFIRALLIEEGLREINKKLLRNP
jgi:hypothetical protein